MGRTQRRGSKNFIPKTEPMKEKRKQSYNQYKGISLDDMEDYEDDFDMYEDDDKLDE